MLLFKLLLCAVGICSVNGNNDIDEFMDTPISNELVDNIEDVIEKFEQAASHAKETNSEGVISITDVEERHNEMAELLDDIIEMLRESSNIHKFVKAEGVDRVIGTNMEIKNTKLHIRFIVLLKILFDAAPVSTVESIPVNVVDNLLDIFENSHNLAIKAHVIDVLSVWLPGNPKIQARVMRVKGLEPFYNQVAKLDVDVIKTLLNLFNKILLEHVRERNTKVQRSKADLEKLRLYQKIALIERMSTPTVCNGLLNIFEVMWNTDDNKALFDIFDLVKNIKQFCMRVYRGKTKAKELFSKLSNYIKNVDNIVLIDKNFNLTDIDSVLSGYIQDIKGVPLKDEF